MSADLYQRVNGAWPRAPLPKLEGQEALTAARRLYRHMLKRTFKGPVRITTGRRYTWVNQGVFVVNAQRGWHQLVHDLSHYIHARLLTTRPGHGFTHASIEREMIEYVVASGWLTGKLRTQPKPKPDLQVMRYQQAQVRLKAWQTKFKRAKTAVRKEMERVKYYEKELAKKQSRGNATLAA